MEEVDQLSERRRTSAGRPRGLQAQQQAERAKVKADRRREDQSGVAGWLASGEVEAAKACRAVESEHWTVSGGLVAVRRHGGVLAVVTAGGVAVRVTTGGTVSIVDVNVAGRLGFRPASKATTVKV